MPVVLVTSRSFSSGTDDLAGLLLSKGYTVVQGPADHDIETLRKPLAEAVGWIAGTGPVEAGHLDLAPRLRVIARYGVGTEAVNRIAARGRGIIVTNTPGANTNAVAEHALGLILAVLRAVPEGDRRVRAGDWSLVRGSELSSLTVGIAGFGRIGQRLAGLLIGFGCNIYAADPYVPVERMQQLGVRQLDFGRMPGTCDIVSLHTPGGSRMVTAAWLAHAASESVLVNTARPELVDEGAVARALAAGRLGGYAADTLAGDTAGIPSPLLAPSLAARIVITPHVGAQTLQAVDQMGNMAVRNLLAVLEGHEPPHRIELEETPT